MFKWHIHQITLRCDLVMLLFGEKSKIPIRCFRHRLKPLKLQLLLWNRQVLHLQVSDVVD